ncbi:MAG: transporter substrate-binding domain-containing protein, partial [Flavobacteriaceae bacterium]|nr:transporter substrate-binding domain-containing protein [Flavobacteriaceae bacterium]
MAFALLLTSSCKNDQEHEQEQTQKKTAEANLPIAYDLAEIKKSGILRAITTFSPTGYFLYRGETMGFQYELLSLLAKSLEVDLEIVLARNIDSVIPMLNRGEGDIIALGYTITGDRKEDVSFTEPFV